MVDTIGWKSNLQMLWVNKEKKINTQKYTVIEVLIFAKSFTCAPRSQSFRALTEALINEGKPEYGRLGCTL